MKKKDETKQPDCRHEKKVKIVITAGTQAKLKLVACHNQCSIAEVVREIADSLYDNTIKSLVEQQKSLTVNKE